MMINMMMNERELKAYRRAYYDNQKAQTAYSQLHTYVMTNPEYRMLTPKQRQNVDKELQKRRMTCHKTVTKYNAVCSKYGVVPGSVL